MTQPRLRNLLALAIWLICAIGFCWTVFSHGGPATYADDSARKVIGAVFLAFGIFGAPLMRLFTRRGSGDGGTHHDERDDLIAAKSCQVGLIVVGILVFCGSIALWEVYQEAGSVPVGWMWVMAYSTLIVTNLAPLTISLILDIGGMRLGR